MGLTYSHIITLVIIIIIIAKANVYYMQREKLIISMYFTVDRKVSVEW